MAWVESSCPSDCGKVGGTLAIIFAFLRPPKQSHNHLGSYSRPRPSLIFKVGYTDSELLLKFIGYFPDYLSALSRTLLRFFWTTFVETAVYNYIPCDHFRGKNAQADVPELYQKELISKLTFEIITPPPPPKKKTKTKIRKEKRRKN